MSDVSEGPGWWQAADLKWYPPELHADYEAPLPPPPKLPLPPDRPPPQIDTPSPPTWDRKPLAIAAGAVIVVIVTAIVGYAFTAPKTVPHTLSQPSTSISQPRSTTVAPVADAALDGLLLSPAEINTTMGATEMTVYRPWNTLNDVGFDNPSSPPECIPLGGAAEAAAYAGSGWTAVRGQTLQEPQGFAHSVDQGVVSFPSAQAAAAFVSASTQRWPACANRSYADNVGNVQWSVGPVSTTNGTVSATTTEQGGQNGWACQRALTARNNVVIDVAGCSHNTTEQGVSLASRIAAKVPT
jgi:serine/threonine kinase PknH